MINKSNIIIIYNIAKIILNNNLYTDKSIKFNNIPLITATIFAIEVIYNKV